MTPDPNAWYSLSNPEEVPSPALLVYPSRIEENIRRMIEMAGGVDRLRPHIKTHKLPEIVRMQMSQGIAKFKCATIAEAELAASCGARDILIAYQPVGPNILRVAELIRRFPVTRFAAVVDNGATVQALSQAFEAAKLNLAVLLDIDCGMHRTGVVPNEEAENLYQQVASMPGLTAAGLHAYDGHIHDSDRAVRERRCEESFIPVRDFATKLSDRGPSVPIIVAGGTPTFPMHARRGGDVECSPGTCLLWDAGYNAKLSDLEFLCAATVFTRVVSKPGVNRLCLDLGHKAIASENPHPRVIFPDLPDAKAVMHSEEHLVLESPRTAEFAIGDALYGIPWHICPTVALYADTVVVKNSRAESRWKIVARQRRLTV